MAIVKMKRLRLMAMQSDREDLLRISRFISLEYQNPQAAAGIIQKILPAALGSHLPIVNRIPDDGLAELTRIYHKENYRKDFLTELSEKYRRQIL